MNRSRLLGSGGFRPNWRTSDGRLVGFRICSTVKERQVPAVFCESTVNDQPQREVAAASGARFGGIFYVDSLSSPEGPAPTLLDLLRHNVDLIRRGLGPDGSPS